jgi:hypothetical protein
MANGRLLRAVVAAAACVMAFGPLLGAGAGGGKGGGPVPGDDIAACGTKGQVAVRADRWVRIASPTYAAGEGSNVVTAFAAPRGLPGWLYATNGKTIQLSVNGGCNWAHVFRGSGRTAAAESQAYRPDVVTHLAAPTDRGLWFAAYDHTDGADHPHVYATTDATPAPGNATKAPITTVEVGLPAVGRPVGFAVARTGPQAFLLLEQPDPASGGLAPVRHLWFTKEDHTLDQAGVPNVTWQEAPLPQGFGPVEGIALSPDSSVNLWVWSGARYARTTDGGTSWQSATAPGPISTIEIDESARAAVYATTPQGPLVERTVEPGKVLARAAVPVAPRSATHGARYGVAAISGDKGTFGFDVNGERWVPLGPRGVPPFTRLHLGSGGAGGILVGQTGAAFYRLDLYLAETFLPPPPGPPVTGDPNDVHLPNSVLHGPALKLARHHVTVAPGATTDVAVDFGVPPDPIPLDVFFLVDTTFSMDNAIAGLRDGIRRIAAEVTRRTHGSTCFGVGDVKDYFPTDPLNTYKVVQPIVCAKDDPHLEKVSAALAKLKAGGGGDDPEAQTVGLTQAVLGTGLVDPYVARDQDARWASPNRVIVLMTDANFHKTGGYPTIDETVRTLHSYYDTKVVGVHVIDNNDAAAARADITAVVAGTKTLAPANGVDCDGDGKADLAPNAPLVCEAYNEAPNIAPAIIGLLLGVRDNGSLAVVPYDNDRVVRSIKGPASGTFNLKVESHLPVTVRLTCRPDQAGKDLRLPLVGKKRNVAVVADTLTVACRAPVIKVPVPPVPPRPPAPEPDPPVPPRPPEPPPGAVQPPSVVNQPPPNVNPNAGFSSQEEEQFQVATVSQDAQEDDGAEDVELAMSAYRRDDDAAALLLLGAATMVSAASGVAVARRRRTAPALARRRAS